MKLDLPEVVFIDLDGTLVDSVPDLTHATNHMLSSLGLAKASETDVRSWVGNGIPRLVERALTRDMEQKADVGLFEKALPLFLDYYQQFPCEKSQVYPGVFKGLNWLKDKQIKLACVTNKDETFTLPLLEKLGLKDYFDLVVCGDTTPHKKPHPAPLLYGVDYFRITPEKALMIGDSVNDVKAANAAGFAIICVSYGYNHGQPISAAAPDTVIDTFAELESLFLERSNETVRI
ncbi:MAG TPA: phosphoglycolate phosphatase [Methylophaga aminisulfidivorans]|uniref:phosphoglycolate phosphatase n=1 Tax=Methylophaga TaxID=40222 RepID=UPI001755A319|nr:MULTISPECIES: phosphoglycolate phosphatase [Methylophaga]HIC46834.1 phosphoglycolate phosphatase [Methylophaga sp.]HIM40374.1 phosphoglycolate phosphatase [Methylophaga aminisulfidivorans]